MKRYYARSENKNGEKQTVQAHLLQTAALCESFLEPIGYEAWGTVLGRFHDFGKYSDRFAGVLERTQQRVNHALPGAVMVTKCYRKTKTEAKMFASIISSHHGGLQSYGQIAGDVDLLFYGKGDGADRDGRNYALSGQKELSDSYAIWKTEVGMPNPLPQIPAAPTFEGDMLSKMLFSRFLFSALVDADWSDAAQHDDEGYLDGSVALDAEKALSKLLALRREKQQISKSASSLNELRDALFDTCLQAGEEEPGLFTLTAPTGLGKTLSLLAFALKQCVVYGKKRVILVLPYLSILEQNAKDYLRVIPELIQIHSRAVTSEADRALTERWDAPCILTTNVGFFEPLFSNQAGDCRHLHQIADSVIVLDEAQTLPGHLLESTLKTVNALCGTYRCTVVFSTATQPSYNYIQGLDWNPREIVFEKNIYFDRTRRVKWNWELSGTSFEELADVMMLKKQCCTIVNMKRHARTLCKRLTDRLQDGSVFYITTDLCPAHRERVLEEVRRRLDLDLPCRLVATQCIEAGVDLDFPVLYRALAPLDSIIQAAGRCNRGGDSPKGEMTVFLPEDEEYPSEDYALGAMMVKNLLARHEIDCSNPSHMEEYYSLLYQNSKGDKQKLIEAIENEDFAAVRAEYKMIPKAGVQVIVPYPDQMELFSKIRALIDQNGMYLSILRLAKDLIVTTFDQKAVTRVCQDLGGGIYLLGDLQYYDSVRGLDLDRDFNGIIY